MLSTCEKCGTEFDVRPHKVREGKGRFCSIRCRHASRVVVAIPYRQSSEGRYEHRRIAARALGKPLPTGAHVHHVNEDTLDNRPSNLVICQDAAYHRLLHVRARVLAAGGDPNVQRFCGQCRTLVVINEMTRNGCRACVNRKSNARYHATKSPTRAYRRRTTEGPTWPFS